VEGVAETNNRISNFMRKLDQSKWFSDPDLRSVVKKEVDGQKVYEFNMRVNVVVPVDEAAGG